MLTKSNKLTATPRYAPKRSTQALLAYSLMACAGSPVLAQVCEVPPLANFALNLPTNIPADLGPEELWIDANEIDGDEEWIVARGDAYLQYEAKQIRGDVVRFNRQTNDASADQATLSSNGFITESEVANFRQSGGSTLTNPEYLISENGAHGKATRVESGADNRVFTAYDIDYSTCNYTSPTWWVDAKSMTYDTETGLGEARHAVVRVKGVPVFYSPRFPINTNSGPQGRQSGILKPQMRYSSTYGVSYLQPLYLNLAPNYDATVSAGVITQAGTLATAEFRYLTENSEGRLEYQELFYRDDQITDRDSSNISRWQHNYENSDLGNGELGTFSLDVDVQSASDQEVLDIVIDSIYDEDIKHLYQGAVGSWQKNFGQTNVTASIQNRRYDALIEPQNSPFFYRPQLKLNVDGVVGNTDFLGAPLRWSADTSYTDLTHPTKLGARRTASNLELSHRIIEPFGFFNTRMQFNALHYNYENDDRLPADFEDSRSIYAPTFEVDSGLVFEKTFDESFNNITHRIEPRVYYAYTPHRDQTGMPRFESTQLSENYNTLFRSSRFDGIDRIADTNKVTVGLENFIEDASGRERLSFQAAQSYLISSPEIQLNGSTVPSDRQWSDLYMDGTMRLTDEISVDAGAQFNGEEYSLELYNVGVNYSDDPFAVRLGYISDPIENSDDEKFFNISGRVPLTQNSRLFGRYQHDIEQNASLEHILGIEFSDCCMAARFGMRNQRDEFDEKFERRYMVEIELGELGSISSGPNFTDRIFGY